MRLVQLVPDERPRSRLRIATPQYTLQRGTGSERRSLLYVRWFGADHCNGTEEIMKRPTITQAKQICQTAGARGAIILVFDEDDIEGASYGETRDECEQLGKTLDRIVDLIGKGHIAVWDGGRVG